MKISILTQPLGRNYGGLLQAYALQLCLKNMGCEVETLDRRRTLTLSKMIRGRLGKLVKPVLKKLNILPALLEYNSPFHHLMAFRDTHLVMSKRITSEAQLRDYYRRHKFDVILVGSDQVWRPRYSASLLNYYLDFLDDIGSKARRVSYAASFGVAEWEYDNESTRVCKALLARFDAVSVREQSAVALCRTHFGITPEWVVDPTLLLEVAEYEKLLSAEPDEGAAGKILSYVLDHDDDKQQIATRIASVLGRKLFSINIAKISTQVQDDDLEFCCLPQVETWLKAFRDTDYVVTDSFHGCVFAILFNKQFLVVGNARRGMARFDSLLSIFGLEDRLLVTKEAATRQRIEAPIDWARVNRVRHEQAEKSKAFLRNLLE